MFIFFLFAEPYMVIVQIHFQAIAITSSKINQYL